MRIYLWGPTATGKTWLFDAFIRKVNLIDEALARASPLAFNLWIEDRLEHHQHRYTLDAAPHTDIDYQEYTLHRQYLLGDNRGRARQACTHSHQFMMLDGPGDETTGQLAIEANTEENRARVLSAHEALKDSDCLLVCVEKGVRTLGPPDPSAPSGFQSAGQHYVERLRHLLNLNRNPEQKIVICFTKSDMYGGKAAGFDAALRRLFGEYGREVGDLLRELGGTRHEPPHYFASAVGYCHNLQGRVVPNFDPGPNALRQPENWNPEDVEVPFFKILNDAELKTLRSMSIDRPGLLGRVSGLLMNDAALRRDLVASYISYDEMVRQVRVRAG